MKRILILSTVLLVGSVFSGAALAQDAQRPQALQASTPVAGAVFAGGNIGLPPLSLRCLEWHCQGSECICIRFTTELKAQ